MMSGSKELENVSKMISRSGMKNSKYSGNMFCISPLKNDISIDEENITSEFKSENTLGKAAEAGDKAKKAVKDERYDDAWGLYHDQKTHYMHHINKGGFSPIGALRLDASVHENLANILRLEGKHQNALVHIVYWVLAGCERPIKRHNQKLQAYFNRCKLKNTSLKVAAETLAGQKSLPQFMLAKSIVDQWLEKG